MLHYQSLYKYSLTRRNIMWCGHNHPPRRAKLEQNINQVLCQKISSVAKYTIRIQDSTLGLQNASIRDGQWHRTYPEFALDDIRHELRVKCKSCIVKLRLTKGSVRRDIILIIRTRTDTIDDEDVPWFLSSFSYLRWWAGLMGHW